MTEPPDRPLQREEPPVRRTATTLRVLTFGIVVFAIIYFVLLVIQNRRKVKVDYVFGSGDHRLIWLIVVCGFLGWLFGLGTSFFVRRRARRGR